MHTLHFFVKGELQVKLPPLPEQKAIAHILGTLDDKIELNQQMNRNLEAIAQAIFKSWFVDFDSVRAKLEGRHEAAVDPNVGYEQQRLLDEADNEFQQLQGEIGEAWWSSLSQAEQQLFDGRPQAEINEMQEQMKKWNPSTYDDVAESILDHSSRKGYEDPLEFLRNVSNFDKSQAERIPEVGVGEKGTVRWEIRITGEYIIETPDGQFVTYGFNPY